MYQRTKAAPEGNRRKRRLRAEKGFYSGLLGISLDYSGSLRRSVDKVYDKVGNFRGGYTPRVLDPLHCYNPCKH